MKELIFTPGKSGVPLVSVAKHGVNFNRKAVDSINSPSHIQIRLWPEKNAIVAVPVEEDEPQAITFAGRMRDGNVRIGSQNLIKFIDMHLKEWEVPSEATRYEISVENINDQDVLIVHLDQPLD